MLLHPFSPHQFINYTFHDENTRLSKSVCSEQEKLTAKSQTMSIDSMCLGDQIVLQPLTDFKASEYLEHFSPLVFIECFCVLMKDIQCWQSQQQLIFLWWEGRSGSKCLHWTASADFPSAGTPPIFAFSRIPGCSHSSDLPDLFCAWAVPPKSCKKKKVACTPFQKTLRNNFKLTPCTEN